MWRTHEQQQTSVFADGTTTAEEAKQEQHSSQSQDHVDPREQQRVHCHDLPEAQWVHQNPDAHAQQEGSAQLEQRGVLLEVSGEDQKQLNWTW